MTTLDLLTPSKIIRSNRKSISLIIEDNGEFIVRSPKNSTDKEIYSFINSKQNWIITKRNQQLNSYIKPLTLVEDSNISVLGKNYTIKLANNSRVKIIDETIYLPCINAKEKIVAYLKKLAKTVISEKLATLKEQYGFNFTSLSINSAKTRWGSCSYNNKLHFTYKLMLCPEAIIDYIIIHELCHTTIKNHSHRFWREVKKYYYNYKQCEIWLKQNRSIINLI